MNSKEQETFLHAMRLHVFSGKYQKLVERHADNAVSDFAHGTYAFLPWHRWFVFELEEDLRALGEKYKCVTIPYWNWAADVLEPLKSPVFQKSSFGSAKAGCVKDGVFGGLTYNGDCLRRGLDTRYRFYGPGEVMELLAGSDNFEDFSIGIEGAPHGRVHVFVGGTDEENVGQMSRMQSPLDPLFWLHHNYIDKLWAMWQDCHMCDTEDEQANPSSRCYTPAGDHTLTGQLDETMEGHDVSVRTALNWQTMGYTYQADTFENAEEFLHVCNFRHFKTDASLLEVHDSLNKQYEPEQVSFLDQLNAAWNSSKQDGCSDDEALMRVSLTECRELRKQGDEELPLPQWWSRMNQLPCKSGECDNLCAKLIATAEDHDGDIPCIGVNKDRVVYENIDPVPTTQKPTPTPATAQPKPAASSGSGGAKQPSAPQKPKEKVAAKLTNKMKQVHDVLRAAASGRPMPVLHRSTDYRAPAPKPHDVAADAAAAQGLLQMHNSHAGPRDVEAQRNHKEHGNLQRAHAIELPKRHTGSPF